MSVYPTDRILSGSRCRPSFVAWASRVWWRSGLRGGKPHNGGNTGVGRPSMRRPPIPWLGAISVLASRSPVRLRGARKGLTETHMASPHGKRIIRQTASSPSIRPGSLRGVEAARVAGASIASAVVVLCRSDSAGHGLRARDDERGGFGPLRRQRWRGHVREIRSFL
jgi:hypothetical protein